LLYFVQLNNGYAPTVTKKVVGVFFCNAFSLRRFGSMPYGAVLLRPELPPDVRARRGGFSLRLPPAGSSA
jgi:hypothetical protein